VIREILRKCSTTKDDLLRFLTKLSKELGGAVEVRDVEGGVYGSVKVNDELVCDVRISEEVCEYYLKVKDHNYLSYLRECGFKELTELISSYGGSYPSEVVISKAVPSRTIYILMGSRDVPKAFPSVRIAYREGFYEASSSYCRLSSDENTCKFLTELLSLAKKYWLEMFE